MTTAYPGGIDSFTDPTSSNALSDPPVKHSAQHANLNDAMHAIESNAVSAINVLSKGIVCGLGPTTAPDMTAQLNAMFATPGTYYFPAPNQQGANLYKISGSVTLAPNTTVICHPDAVFYLANGAYTTGSAHIYMFKTDQSISNNGVIRWIGGTINGNEENQASVTADGTNYDTIKGQMFANCTKVELRDITYRHCRGSGVEYWNATSLVARNLTFDQLVDPRGGGYRRGGITGSAQHVDIDGVRGFTSDDMVSIAAGVTWPVDGTIPAVNIYEANISNVTCWDRTDNSVLRGTWQGVTAYGQNGGWIHNLNISNVAGRFQGPAVRVGSYAYGSDPVGTLACNFDNIVINNVNGIIEGWTAPDGQGTLGNVPGEGFISFPSLTAANTTVSNVSWKMPATEIFDLPIICASAATADRMSISNVKFSSDGATANLNPLLTIGGSGHVNEISMSNCSVTYPSASAWGSRWLFNTWSTDTQVMRLRVDNCSLGDVPYGTNTISVTSALVCPFGDGIVFNLSAASLSPVEGSNFTDPAVGVVAYQNGNWVQRNPVTLPYATNNGLPTSGKWFAGMRVNVTGSPFESLPGYVCITSGTYGSGNPTFRPLANPAHYNLSAPTPTSSITNWPSGTVSTQEIGSAGASGWPGNAAGAVTTHRGAGDIYSFQMYYVRQATTTYIRYWNTTTVAWSAWTQVNA